MAEETFLSLVIPCYNEQENVDVLLTRVDGALSVLESRLKSSSLTTAAPMTRRNCWPGMQKYPWLRVLRMAKNGGQSAAFEAGFEAAAGRSSPPSTPICKTIRKKFPG